MPNEPGPAVEPLLTREPMTTPTPTLPESAADVVPDDVPEDIYDEACRVTGIKHGVMRACYRAVSEALASRSTQPERKELGRISFELWSSGAFYGKTWEELMPGTKEFWARQEVLHGVAWASAGLKRKDDLLPQPEAAASGDVGRLVEAAKEVLSFRVEGPTRGWLRDNGASRAALQKLADALIPQPSAPAGEVQMTEEEIDLFDAPATITMGGCKFEQTGTSCGSSGPRFKYSAWFGPAQLAVMIGWQPRQPEPGSTQGGETR